MISCSEAVTSRSESWSSSSGEDEVEEVVAVVVVVEKWEVDRLSRVSESED